MTLCPCQVSPTPNSLSQAIAYSDCCQPYHNGLKKAETAERLMRTRYSAFVKVLPEYIVTTTLPVQQSLLDVAAIEDWAKQTPWAELEIIQHTPKLGKRHAQVEFKAFYTTADAQQAAHHERSTFVKIKDEAHKETWFFLDPTVAMSVTQKQPCICGSGEKFKRCCGVYLA
ncbi:YchJ family protein [uncultured Psychrobacter sp.]|uniref:YchJ family protein n=1 Tax=uncultured Psychrobacter sp. TaxID=259303 RepID=UPI0026379143|nr:YchJ family protein [uncultured Psychrobacter sp.]